MKISIITACLNNEETIAHALESLKGQDYPDVEHMVKDGESTDRTLEIIRERSPDSKILKGPDSGLYDALNKAIAESEGDIIGLLHADDLYHSARVLTTVADTFTSTNCDAVYGNLKYVDRENPKKVRRTWVAGEYKEGSFLNGWMPPHPTVFVKREVFEQYGNFNTVFKTAADYEWLLRVIHKHRIGLSYIPEFLIDMRVGGQSNVSLKNRLNANIEDRRAWKVNNLNPHWYTLYLKPLRKMLQFV